MTTSRQNIFRLLSAFAILWSCNTPAYANDMRITVTLPPLAGLVHLVAPDANVSCLLPGKADPHHFELSPRQIETLKNSDLLIRASSDDAHWHGLDQAKKLDLWPGTSHADSHSWLNPANARQMVESLAAAVPDVDVTALERAKTTIAATQQNWLSVLPALKKRGVIMQHPAWEHFFEAMGIPVLAVLESDHHGQEQGPRALESALNTLKANPDAVLIGDTNHSNRTLQWIARHANDTSPDTDTIIYMDALGNCSESWAELMQRNLDILASGLATGTSMP
ncbi:MAG: hypothetical protein AUJ56_00190 [Zetaproteobacteria bacterium CG1_02_49_23]|nr:MAG: hypothetical protein AUJ56_00190 [Zetaproteobacteria bacterium CG1_02_49_23]